MGAPLDEFERIVRSAGLYTDRDTAEGTPLHPFEQRNVYEFDGKVRRLFDDGHYAEATFTACKIVEKRVRELSRSNEYGKSLMMLAFRPDKPLVQLTPCITDSELEEQDGYKFLFAGYVGALRNPRGHEVAVEDDLDTCLDHLVFLSMLMRRLEQTA